MLTCWLNVDFMHHDKTNNLHPYRTHIILHWSLKPATLLCLYLYVLLWRVLFYCFYWPCSRVCRCSIHLQIVLKLTNRSDLFLLGDFLSLRLNTWHRNRQRCQTAPASLPWLMTLSTFGILKSLAVCVPCLSSVCHRSQFPIIPLWHATDGMWACVNVCACMTLASEFSLKPCCISK